MEERIPKYITRRYLQRLTFSVLYGQELVIVLYWNGGL